MAVITITGQFGAGEDQLAARIVEKTGYLHVNRGIFEKVLKEYGIVNFKELLDKPLHFMDRLAGEKKSTSDLLNKMYLLFAKKNNIVLHSRRAFVVLESFVNVLNVFVKAPESARVRNLVGWENIGERSAADKIEQQEDIRRGVIESYYKKKWDSVSPWTLVLNTHKLGLDLCEKIILEANLQISKFDDVYGWQDGFPSIDTIETDSILERAVKKVMENEAVPEPRKET
jgi:cytidylate kinase